MTQPPATPPPPQPPASEAAALEAWKAEQQYGQFKTMMDRWFSEKAKEQQAAPPKTEKPRGGFLDSFFGG
jgi:hypothetical protein